MTATWNLPSGPQAAGAARRALRGWLEEAATGPDDDARDSIVLAASEVAANAGTHGVPPVTLTVTAVETRTGAEVIVTVADASPVIPAQRRAAESDERGRGLAITEAVTDWIETCPVPGGKQVRFGVTVPGLADAGRGRADGGAENGDPFGITGSGSVPEHGGNRVLAS